MLYSAPIKSNCVTPESHKHIVNEKVVSIKVKAMLAKKLTFLILAQCSCKELLVLVLL